MRVVPPPVIVRRIFLLLFLLLLCFLNPSSTTNVPPPDFPKVSELLDWLAQAVHVLREGQQHPVPHIQLAVEFALAQVEGQVVKKRGEWEDLEHRTERRSHTQEHELTDEDDNTHNDGEQQQQQQQQQQSDDLDEVVAREVPLLQGLGKALWSTAQ